MEKKRSDTYVQLEKIVPRDVGLEKVLATCRFPGKKKQKTCRFPGKKAVLYSVAAIQDSI